MLIANDFIITGWRNSEETKDMKVSFMYLTGSIEKLF
jgi:hypothetical protein